MKPLLTHDVGVCLGERRRGRLKIVLLIVMRPIYKEITQSYTNDSIKNPNLEAEVGLRSSVSWGLCPNRLQFDGRHAPSVLSSNTIAVIFIVLLFLFVNVLLLQERVCWRAVVF